MEEIITSKDGKTKLLKTTRADGTIHYSFIDDTPEPSEEQKKYNEGVIKFLKS